MIEQYLLIYIWSLVAFLISKRGFSTDMVAIEGCKTPQIRIGTSLLIFAPLILLVTFRGWIGDTYLYYKTFMNAPTKIGELIHYMQGVDKDKGFYLLTAVLRILSGDNYQILFFVLAAIQSFFLIKIYKKYSINFALSFFLFIASTDYLSWMTNGVRQFTAVTIVFGAITSILDRKYLIAVLIIVFASFFHGTALLVLPFVFICQGKAWNKKTIMFLFGVMISVILVGQVLGFLNENLQDTQYKNVISDITIGDFSEDDGTNPLRVLVYSIPTILSFFYRREIDRYNNPIINLCVNMSIISLGFYVFSIFSSGIMMGRLPIYFSLYNYILLPWEIENLKILDKRTMYCLLFICYTIFYLFQLNQFGLLPSFV